MTTDEALQHIEDALTDADIEAWHEGELTDHVEQLLDETKIDIAIWGSRQGPEPLTVTEI